jgi:hypothetical protein
MKEYAPIAMIKSLPLCIRYGWAKGPWATAMKMWNFTQTQLLNIFQEEFVVKDFMARIDGEIRGIMQPRKEIGVPKSLEFCLGAQKGLPLGWGRDVFNLWFSKVGNQILADRDSSENQMISDIHVKSFLTREWRWITKGSGAPSLLLSQKGARTGLAVNTLIFLSSGIFLSPVTKSLP